MDTETKTEFEKVHGRIDNLRDFMIANFVTKHDLKEAIIEIKENQMTKEDYQRFLNFLDAHAK